MLQKWSRYKILEKFFDFPRREFFIRELSRETNLAQTAVTNHIKALLKEKLILKEKRLYPIFKANRDNTNYKLLKKQNLILRLHGLLTFLEKEIYPTCIVLFGSGSRGEDSETSDIDLFIQAKETELNRTAFEKKLNRKIALFFEPKVKDLSKELLNNIINGDVVYGYLKVLR